MESANPFYIYWERQGKAHTCGMHTINCILQAPVFNKATITVEAERIRSEQALLCGDLAEDIIDEDGCSFELISSCLLKHNIQSEHINLKNEYEWQLLPGLIFHTGDHFFALVNYQKFWINFDSLSERGPEFLVPQDFYDFLVDRISKGSQLISIIGNLPNRFQSGKYQLLEYQKFMTLNEVIEESQVIKICRITQHEVVKEKILKKTQELEVIEENEQLNLAIKLSLEDDEKKEDINSKAIVGNGAQKNENLKPEIDYKVIREDEVKEMPVENIKLRVCKPNKRFTTVWVAQDATIGDFKQLAFEIVGGKDVNVFQRLETKKYLLENSIPLKSLMNSQFNNIFFLESA